MGKVEQVSKQILAYLLQDFQARELAADALDEEYVGLGMNDLKQKCFERDNTSTAVDFDVALKGLEDNKLIGTGPMEVYDNPPGSSVVVIGLYSKREYAYLTKKGYKAAR
jgi:hypothetical protein